MLNDFLYFQQQNYNRLFNRTKNRNINKTKNLLNKKHNLFTTYNASWFKNISTIVVPEHIQGFLALGPKFSLPMSPQDVDIFTLISEVEMAIQYRVGQIGHF